MSSRKTTFSPQKSLIDRKKLLFLVNTLKHAGRTLGDGSLEMSIACLPQRNKRKILRDATRVAVRCGLDPKKLFLDDLREGCLPLNDTLVGLHRNARLKPILDRSLLIDLTILLDAACKCRMGPSPFQKNLDEVATIFGLDDIEKEIVLCMFLWATNAMIDRLYDELHAFLNIKTQEYCTPAPHPRIFAIMMGLPKTTVEKVFRKDSKFGKSGNGGIHFTQQPPT